MKRFLFLTVFSLNVFSNTDDCLNKLKVDANLKNIAYEFEKTNSNPDQFKRDFYKLSESYFHFNKIKRYLDSKEIKLKFVNINEDKRCHRGSLAYFEIPNQVTICMNSNFSMGRILDITIHEALHYFQHNRMNVEDLFTFEYNGEKGILTKALNYSLDIKKHKITTDADIYHMDSMKLLKKHDRILVENFFDKLDEIGKYFYISEDLGFEIKKPEYINVDEALSQIPKEIIRLRDTSKTDLAHLIDKMPQRKSRILQMIKNRFVANRFLGPLAVYCYEVQANILSFALNYSRFHKVRHIPECLKLFPQVKTDPIKNFEEFNHLMTEAGREYVSRIDKYGQEFSRIYGFKGFEKYFNPMACGQGEIP